jgi:hypothetical protein
LNFTEDKPVPSLRSQSLMPCAPVSQALRTIPPGATGPFLAVNLPKGFSLQLPLSNMLYYKKLYN